MKVGLLGCSGRMGRAIASAAEGSGGACEIAAGFSRSWDGDGCGFPVHNTALPVFKEADVVVDFSHAEALELHLQHAADEETPLLIGTSGHVFPVHETVGGFPCRSPILYSTNTSISVHILAYCLAFFCKRTRGEWDVSIIERHRQGKRDAPSGTALMLRDRLLDCGMKEMSVLSVRAADVPGEHTVSLCSADEEVSFFHRALKRDVFAKGALCLAAWLIDQRPGFYTMDDFVADFCEERFMHP